jgi:signal transduction histidine kinase
VSDTGPGIPENLYTILRISARDEGPQQMKEQGWGLPSPNRYYSHGGKIWAKQTWTGSTFIFSCLRDGSLVVFRAPLQEMRF